jgi:hypothetical protein
MKRKNNFKLLQRKKKRGGLRALGANTRDGDEHEKQYQMAEWASLWQGTAKWCQVVEMVRCGHLYIHW